MSLKFNPFTGTFDFTESAATKEKAEGIPEGGATSTVLMKKSATNYDDEWKLVANANVASSAAIAESKLSLPEVVIKTTEQTITGTKNFTPTTPAKVEGSGAAGTVAVVITGGNGQEATLVGGEGSAINISAGSGAKATNTTKANATGGNGSSITLKAGAGGEAVANEAAEVVGSLGGSFSVEAGAGGSASGAGAGIRRAAAGGNLTFFAGPGGNVASGTGERTAGPGGELAFEGGKGGTVTAGSTTAGAGGPINFTAGNSGGSIGSPLGGAINYKAGSGTTDALSGAINFTTGKSGGLTRFTINGEGNAEFTGKVKVNTAPTRPTFSASEGAVEVGANSALRRVVVAYTAKKEAKVKVKHALKSESLNITALTFTSATKLYVPFAIKEWKVLTAEEVEITWTAEPAAKAEILILIDG